MDIFISWTENDRDVKNVIVNKLHEAGMSCWDSDRHCTSEFAGECIDAIRQCSVFLVIVSEASMKASYVKNEITEARERERLGKLNILVYKITDEPYTQQFAMLLNHISYVTGNLFQRTSSVARVSNIDHIVHRAGILLKKRRDGKPEKPYDVYIPEIDGMKLKKTGYFVEGSRDNILLQMEENLKHSNILILTEFFGYGKRSTVRKFVEKNSHKYSTAVMVQNECANLREFIASGLDFLNVNEKVFEDLAPDALLREKFRFLEKLDARTLLVVQDVRFDAQPDAELCEMLAGLNCHVFLLTQENADGYADWFPVIRVGGLQENHLLELFFHHYARAYEEEKALLTEPLMKFFADIGGHTKTVELTATTLNRDLDVRPEDVPRYLSVQSSEGMQLKDRILQQIGSVFNADQLGEDACIALLTAAYLAVPYISEQRYRDVLKQCGVVNWKTVLELDKLCWLDVDVYNRTISMEPLVAQIVLSKIPEAYPVMGLCFDNLMNSYLKYLSFSISGTEYIHSMNKLAYFCSVTGLPECAEVLVQMCKSEMGNIDFDGEKMAEAIRNFENAYPLYEEFETNETVEDTTVDADEEDFQETRNEEEYICSNRCDFEERVVSFVRGTIPLGKMISGKIGKVFFDFSSEGNRIFDSTMKNFPGSDAFLEIFGMSAPEFSEMLEDFRSALQSYPALDEESLESVVYMEAMAMISGFLDRDPVQLQTGMLNLLDHLCKYPAELFSEATMRVVISGFQMVCKMYFTTGTLSAVVVLCEKMLQLQVPTQVRNYFLSVYVTALINNHQYTPSLYMAYEELLDNYDLAARDVFELHTNMLTEKKTFLLGYAGALAMGERIDDALVQFAGVRTLKVQSLMDEEAECAQTIVDVLVKTGGFQRALMFIEQYFPPAIIEMMKQTGNQQTQQIMEDFCVYRTAGQITDTAFAQDSNPRKYISYYKEFSRKNNSLLESKYLKVADQAIDYDFSELTNEEIAVHTERLRKRAQKEKMLSLAPEAFALASEAGYRVLGYRHHLVQMMGAAAMADGKIAEILNGEGKTYTILLTAFLQHLYGRSVFVIDRSPYLTRRNYQWMRGVYDLLGVPTDHYTDKNWRPIDSNCVVYMDLVRCILTYLQYELHSDRKCSYPMDTVIIDEADTTLVDMADQKFEIAKTERKPFLLIQAYGVWELVKDLPDNGTLFTCKKKKVSLLPAIYPRIEAMFSVSYADIAQVSRIRRIEKSVMWALWSRFCVEKDKDYFIHNGKPVFEDKTSGVFYSQVPEISYYLCRENELDTRRIEQKLINEKSTLNTINLRDYFKRFSCVCGTTATAVSFREEFREIYGLDCYCVPPHTPVIREDLQSPVYVSIWAKEQAIMELVQQKAAAKQPLLIITQSTQESERYSRLLKRRGIEHKLLNARNADEFSDVIVWAGVSGSVVVANALAGRGADIKLGGNPELKTRQELVEMGEDITELDSFVYSVPTAEQKATALYQKYNSILEKNKTICAADRQKVVEAGGLCVIGTGFFPEPRTEQQTRGRSGRQGEVGESWVFQSIEDEELQPLVNTALMSKIFDKLLGDDVESLDGLFLHKSIQNAQKTMHKQRFAGIREKHSNDQHLDKARADFIGRRFALQERQLRVDDLLQEWAQDKTVLEQLELLRKGGKTCDIPVLYRLYQKYPQLESARGGKTSKIIYDVILKELAENFLSSDFPALEDMRIRDLLCKFIMEAWEKFIGITDETVGRVDMNEQALAQFLEGEKKRLMREPVERLLSARLKIGS